MEVNEYCACEIGNDRGIGADIDRSGCLYPEAMRLLRAICTNPELQGQFHSLPLRALLDAGCELTKDVR